MQNFPNLNNSIQKLYLEIVNIFPRIILAILVFVIIYLFARLLRSVVRKTMAKTSTEGHVDLIVSKIIYISVLVFGGVSALSIAGVNLTALVAGLGLAGFAFGFALKDIVGNFLSGIIILFQRPFTIGDQIIIENVEGTVQDIRVRDTLVKTFDGRYAFIPNNIIFNSIITNNTAANTRRVDVQVGVEYITDLENVINICHQVMGRLESVEKEPEPVILVREFAESSIILELRCWTNSTNFQILDVTSKLIQNVKKEFDRNKINIPFPIRNVLIKKE